MEPVANKTFNPRRPDYKDDNGLISIWVDQNPETMQPIMKVKVFNLPKTIICKPSKTIPIQQQGPPNY